MKPASLLLAAAFLLGCGTAWSASFDCAKARRPLEKLICASPELDAEDTRMGEVLRRVDRNFPLRGFVMLTQRDFLAGYPACMSGRAPPDAARACAGVVRARIDELETLSRARVYASTPGPFSQEELAILVSGAPGPQSIRLWGAWMPDMREPRPFPAGVWCDITETLRPVAGGFRTESTGEAVFRITDTAVSISEFISCSPRTGIGAGEYRRVR